MIQESKQRDAESEAPPPGTWLVVAADADVDAVWLVAQLEFRGVPSVSLLTAGELVHEARWEHRLGNTAVSSIVRFPDGRAFEDRAVGVVLNRLSWVSAHGFLGASMRDRVYATQEFQALTLSWLAGFGDRVLNRPCGLGLAADWRSPEQWRSVGAQVGLSVHPWTDTLDGRGGSKPTAVAHHVLVIDGAAIGAQTSDLEAGCVALAKAAGTSLLEVRFAAKWQLLDATTVPQRNALEPAAIDALAAALKARAEAS